IVHYNRHSRIQTFTNTVAFLNTRGSSGRGDGQFIMPLFVAVDGSGNVLVVGDRMQKFTNTGTFLTTWGGPGNGNGQFASPAGVAVDGSGNVFVADTDNNRSQKFTNTGQRRTR